MEPGLVAGGNPAGLACACLRLQGQVQLGGLVEQALFQQPVEHGAQAHMSAPASRRHAMGEADQMPGQGLVRHHGNRLAGAARIGQQACGGVAMPVGAQAVTAECVGVFASGARRQMKNQGAHGRKRAL